MHLCHKGLTVSAARSNRPLTGSLSILELRPAQSAEFPAKISRNERPQGIQAFAPRIPPFCRSLPRSHRLNRVLTILRDRETLRQFEIQRWETCPAARLRDPSVGASDFPEELGHCDRR